MWQQYRFPLLHIETRLIVSWPHDRVRYTKLAGLVWAHDIRRKRKPPTLLLRIVCELYPRTNQIKRIRCYVCSGTANSTRNSLNQWWKCACHVLCYLSWVTTSLSMSRILIYDRSAVESSLPKHRELDDKNVVSHNSIASRDLWLSRVPVST